jgi:cytochrome c-type biogenesis protein
MIDFSASLPQATPLMMLGAGLLAFVSPCVLPMLPVYALYLLGGDAGDRAGWALVLRRCLGLAAGFVLLFTVIGGGAGLLGGALKRANRNTLDLISGGLLIVLGMGMMGAYRLAGMRLPKGFAGKMPRMSGFWGAFAFGLVLALSFTPCLTPLLAGALFLAASAEGATMVTGMFHLALFALGLCMPMLLFMLLYQWLKAALTWLKTHQLLLRRVGGGLMVAYGLYLVISALG